MTGDARGQVREGRRPTLRTRTIWIWATIWLLTRAYMVAKVGFWDHVEGVELEDVNSFESWSHILAVEHTMPGDEGWQYPPGAAFVMLVPRIGGAPFGQSFMGTMLLVDLAGLALVSLLAKRSGSDTGVWVWLLTLPVLGQLPLLRFDLVPTVLAIAALVVIHRRPAWFGALAGLGASVKVWPIVVLFGEWDRRRLAIAAASATGAMALVFVVAAIGFGDQVGFLDNQSVRGIQVESVAATPWRLQEILTGRSAPIVPRNGTNEVGSALADSIAAALNWLSIVVLGVAALWWRGRERAIQAGRGDLAEPAVSRDFVFAIVLALVVTSRVLSPQFMIWLVGLAAVVLSSERTRLNRAAWTVLAAALLTATFAQAPVHLVLRNALLLFAAIDAAIAMGIALRGPLAAAGTGSAATRLARHDAAGKPGGEGRHALDPL